MEENVASLILSASKMPGYKRHPYDTYAQIKKVHGIANIQHPQDVYGIDINILRKTAQGIIGDHQRWFAATGFAAGLPGGPIAVATAVVDIEEYLRRIFLLSQEIGHVYGLIPNPFSEKVDDDIDIYFETVKEEILKAMLIGLGAGGFTIGVAEVAKMLAEKEAKDIVAKKINDKVITQLVKEIAKFLGKKVTKDQIAKGVLKFVPIVGGGINAVGNYNAIGYIGENLIESFEKEHNSVKSRVQAKCS